MSMKRKKFFTVLVGLIALVLILGLNVRHAINDYGMSGKALSLVVLAETSESGSGGATCTCVACANGASNASCLNGEGWTQLKTTTTFYFNGNVIWEQETYECSKGGPLSSCTSGCRSQGYINGKPQGWTDC